MLITAYQPHFGKCKKIPTVLVFVTSDGGVLRYSSTQTMYHTNSPMLVRALAMPRATFFLDCFRILFFISRKSILCLLPGCCIFFGYIFIR